jgi:hypothetical protein
MGAVRTRTDEEQEQAAPDEVAVPAAVEFRTKPQLARVHATPWPSPSGVTPRAWCCPTS